MPSLFPPLMNLLKKRRPSSSPTSQRSICGGVICSFTDSLAYAIASIFVSVALGELWRGKIAALCNLLDDGFFLTYSDEDGDVVALVDDKDLFDVTNLRLKFLKISVHQNPVVIIQKDINDVMMAVPNPMRDTITKVYIDLTSKAPSSSPVVGELFDCISKLGKLSIPQEGTPCSSVTKPGSSVPSTGEKKDISKKSQTGKKPATSGHVPTSMGVGAKFD
ncbi:hypothetical protein Bca4012_003899 [Brassica carinata]